MKKCCENCKWLFRDESVDHVECNNDNPGDWIYQESEAYYTPSEDCCDCWQPDDEHVTEFVMEGWDLIAKANIQLGR